MKKIYLAITLALFASQSIAANAQSKYLGKEKEGSEQEEVKKPKVNLLDDSVIEKNPHYQNESFWAERKSSKVVNNDVVEVALSDTLFEMTKSATETAPSLGTNSDDLESAKSSDSKAKNKGKSFKPPKKALVGHDHHHQYSKIEESFGGKYSPRYFNYSIAGSDTKFTIESQSWAKDSEGRSILVSDISLSSNGNNDYANLSEYILPISERFMETLLPIKSEDLSVSVLNENPDEFASAEYDFLKRDICVVNNNSSEDVLVRMSIKTEDKQIDRIRVFSGMKCGA